MVVDDRLGFVLDAAPSMIAYVGADRRLGFCNHAYESWFDAPPGSLRGRHIRDLLGPPVYAIVEPYIERALDGEQLRFEGTMPHPDRGERQFAAAYIPDPDAAGIIRGFVAVVDDVTDRRRAETELARAHEQTAELLASIGDCFCAFDGDWRFTYVNAKAEEYFRRPKQAMLGRVIWEAFPQSRDSPLGEYADRPQRDRGPAHFEMLSPVSGRWVELHAYPSGDGVSIFFRDIGERKAAEAALLESERRFRVLADTAPVLIWVLGPTGYEFVNRAYAETVGCKYAELLGVGWHRSVHPDDLPGYLAALDAAAARREGFRAEKRLRRADGAWRWMLASGSPRLAESGELAGFVGSCVDITDRRQSEERLRQADRMETAGRLAGGVAHEANNQMSVVLGCAEFILARRDLPESVRQDVEQMQRAAERTASVTAQLLAFSRRQVLRLQALDVNALVAGMEPVLARTLGERSALRLRLAPGRAVVRADPGQVEQVLLNLVLNARDAMPRGGTLTVETAVTDFDPGYVERHPGVVIVPAPHIAMVVTDSGHGMDRQTLEHIFEPFFTTKGVGHGSGLGLATVYGIVKQLNGYVWAYSEPGRGTAMKVYLPAVGAAPAPRPSPAPMTLAEAGQTALVVEDDERVRAIAVRSLEEAGYHVLHARDGEAALALIGLLGPGLDRLDVLVTDLAMPQMDGRSLAARMLAQQPDLPVLFMSGYTDDEVMRQGLLADGQPFIQKPFTPNGLAERVRGVIAARPGKPRTGGRAVDAGRSAT